MYVFIATFPTTFSMRLDPSWPRDDFKAMSVTGDKLQEESKGRPVRGSLYWVDVQDGEPDSFLHIASLDLHWDQNEFQMVVTTRLGDDYKREEGIVPVPESPPARTERRMNFRRR